MTPPAGGVRVSHQAFKLVSTFLLFELIYLAAKCNVESQPRIRAPVTGAVS
jgi:hypothetical protein